MTTTVSNVKSRNVLVLGAGELGMPVLRNLARCAEGIDGAKISVLLRAGAVESDVPAKQRDVAEIRNLGIEIVIGDLVKSSIDGLASLFSQYDTVIGCTGYAAGVNAPMKLAKAALQSGIPRYFPLAVRRRFSRPLAVAGHRISSTLSSMCAKSCAPKQRPNGSSFPPACS